MKKIVLCVDNSDGSTLASGAALGLAKKLGLEVTGVHGYNAVMHEGAFRMMEPILPERFQKEEILKKQREVHSSLISVGMRKISLSYLKPHQAEFEAAGVAFQGKVAEGKNFKALEELISAEDPDLTVIGATGFSDESKSVEGFLGSVCLRVVRDLDRDFLVVKKPVNLDNPVYVVGLDGSAAALKTLSSAKTLAVETGATLHLVYVFDTKLHRDVFAKLKDALINSEGFKFNTAEQDKNHDEFIDKGLHGVGMKILSRGVEEVLGTAPNSSGGVSGVSGVSGGFGLVGDAANPPFITKVLEGYTHKRICEYAAEVGADMIFVGRTGRHFIEGMDLGSTAENVLRYAAANVFVTGHIEHDGWRI